MDSFIPFSDMNIQALLIPPRHFPFRALPQEIQLHILKFLMADHEPIDDVTTISGNGKGNWFMLWKPQSGLVNPNTIFASKWFYKEGLKLLYGENRFRFLNLWLNPDDKGMANIFDFFNVRVIWYSPSIRGGTEADLMLMRKDLIRHIIIADSCFDKESDISNGILQRYEDNPESELDEDELLFRQYKDIFNFAWRNAFIKALLWSGMNLLSLSIIFDPSNKDQMEVMRLENRFTKSLWIQTGKHDTEEDAARARWWLRVLDIVQDPYRPVQAYRKLEYMGKKISVQKVFIRGISEETAFGQECAMWLRGTLPENTRFIFGGELAIDIQKFSLNIPVFRWIDANGLSLEVYCTEKAIPQKNAHPVTKFSQVLVSPSKSFSNKRTGNPPTSLLGLDGSISRRILSHALIKPGGFENPTISRKHKERSGVSTSILTTCKGIYALGLEILYGSNLFRLTPTSREYKITETEIVNFISKPLYQLGGTVAPNRAYFIRKIVLSEELTPRIALKFSRFWHWEISVLRAFKYSGFKLDLLSLSFSASFGPQMESQDWANACLNKELSRFISFRKAPEQEFGAQLQDVLEVKTLVLSRSFDYCSDEQKIPYNDEMWLDARGLDDKLVDLVLEGVKNKKEVEVVFAATSYH
jgi:hypothetical protein